MKKRFDRTAQQVRVRVGESFVLELPAQGTAGYSWLLAAQPGVLALREQETHPASQARGAPSVQELEFTAVRLGHGTLILEYKRPWETAVVDRLEVEIIVDRESLVD